MYGIVMSITVHCDKCHKIVIYMNYVLYNLLYQVLQIVGNVTLLAYVLEIIHKQSKNFSTHLISSDGGQVLVIPGKAEMVD